jgi:hypothetical protein
MLRTLGVLLAMMVATASVGSASASAATPGSAWTISSTANPTNFSSGDNEKCEELGVCDSYTLLATNRGGSKTDGSLVTVAAQVPAGVTVKEISGIDWAQNEIGSPLECTTVPLQCIDERAVASDDTLQVTVKVEVTTASGELLSSATVNGGGAAPAETHAQTPISSTPAPFGVQSLSFATTGLDGSPETQAGGHPYELTTGFTLPSRTNPDSTNPYRPTQQPKDVVVYLPPGLLGDPQATPRCPLTLLEGSEYDFNSESPTFGQYLSSCPPASRVGVVGLASGDFGGLYAGSLKLLTGTTSVFNMVPEGHHVAELGFRYLSYVILMYADIVKTSSGYRVRVTIPGVPRIDLLATTLTLFGEPGRENREPSSNAAFLANPTRCTSSPVRTTVEAESWEEPGHWVSTAEEPTVYPHIDGCNLLQFEPTLSVAAETTQTDTPSGLEVDVRVPNAWTAWPIRVTPELKDAAITFPPGLSVSPSAADGLTGCEQTGPNGIDIPRGTTHADEAGEGEAIGAEGLSYPTPGHCPQKSQIGTVEVKTPLLGEPLKGHVYVAQPTCAGDGCEQAAEEGKVFGIYLEIAGSGVIVKLKGSVEVGGYGHHNDLAPGQLRTKFAENPQMPFEELKLTLDGGQRSALANPQTCGTATTTSDLEPWSAPESGPNATPSWPFTVSGCANPMGFAPGFSAGTVQTLAGGFSPFTMTLTRKDGEQDLAGVSLTMPPGVAGMLSKVALCPEPQASLGTCGPESRIGTTNAAAGAGSEPLWLSGPVYLTGPYNKAPFGLSIVVPAKAGPFNLGNVIERAAIAVDPKTAQVTVSAGPLQQSRDGVPFRLKTLNVTIDREGFMFNPTNCSQLHVTGTVSADMPDGSPGATVPVSTPFAVAGCKNLPFKPSLQVSTSAKTSRKNGASLHVVVRSGAGQANIHSVHVTLPKIMPSRLPTLQQACIDTVFNENPAKCPAGSKVGGAVAHTPVLAKPLSGPMYFVSHGGAAFPDLVAVLQGEGVTVELVGQTAIKNNVTSSTFASVPDVPIVRFDMTLPQGTHSVLTAIGSLCKQRAKLTMPTTIRGQNGAVVKQTTKVAVSGCPKPKKRK